MWLYCNGYWATIDNTKTLLLERIVQFFDPTKFDFLDIVAPSVLYAKLLHLCLLVSDTMLNYWKMSGEKLDPRK